MMKVYSGDVCLCETGLETKLKCDMERPLKTGDIVIIGKAGSYIADTLSVVVQEDGEDFCMGIRNICVSDPEKLGGWWVTKVKDHSDVIDGEHWKAYGFNYRQ